MKLLLDNILKLIDIRTFEVVKNFRSNSYKNGVNWNEACFSPNGKWIAAGSENGTVVIWSLDSGDTRPVLQSNRNDTITCCSWVSNQLLTSDKGGSLSIWSP